MKKLFNIQLLLLLLITGIFFSSCEKKYDGTYQEYTPTFITNENIGLKYDPQEIEVYPIVGNIYSDTPTVAVDQLVVFGIDTAFHSAGDTAYNRGKIHIDKTRGVIWYDNSLGTLLPGDFSFDVSVVGSYGFAVVKDAFRFKVLEVPISVTASPDNVEVSSIYEGVISTLSYEVVGNPDEPITSVSYQIKPAVTGFSVDNQGKILKNVNASTGDYSLTILATTNLGARTFKNLITVHVGQAPTLKYLKHDGGDLTKVILSPGSSYTTVQPELTGMQPSAWALKTDGLPQALIDALSIDNNGVITLASNGNIPEGDYEIGVIITSDAGVDVPFANVFTMSFQVQWDEVNFTGNEFDPANGQTTYGFDPGSTTHFTYDSGNTGQIKGYHGPDALFNSWFTTIIPIGDDWNGAKLLISFEEKNGWGPNQDPCYQEFVRTVQYSYNETDWTDIMPADDPDWPSTGSGGFNPVSNQEVSGLDVSNATLYVKWHYDNSASDTKTKSVWMLDNLKFKYTVNYDPVEE